MLRSHAVAFGSAVAILVTLTTGSARAGFVPTTVTVAPEHGNFRWTYAVVLPSYTKLQSGDYFSIYDFNGLVPGATGAPTGWTLTTPPVGPHPAHVTVFDDPAVPNLVWTYHGATRMGRVGLGNFWATSRSGSSEVGLFVGHNARSWDGVYDTNVTETKVPTPAPPGVPEPGTFILAAVGLSFLGLVRRGSKPAAA